MSCNGCRVLRKGCSDTCILRPCLHWIQSADAQGNATIFVAKFFGRAGLLSFISAVPENQRPSLFQSLLYEAAGRTVNPVNGAVGLLGSGNWHVCQAAVETVLRGGELRPIPEFLGGSDCTDDMFKLQDPPSIIRRSTVQKRSTLPDGSSRGLKVGDLDLSLTPGFQASIPMTGNTPLPGKQRWPPRTLSMNSEESITCFEGGFGIGDQGGVEPKLLNLF
ncbi:PREDICTED: LOB domain-containing protein 37-like [Ipomoea nil]|uniref:LOB domain-containing protein 37-like n=1 Tax=Ipomoea nil TaxID=35883 RepID=UPI000900AEFF|nr:PREDICTED: LOB domain-containing protein 37-like [Ipomoea nil]XP_019195382.1 PREDICTED: LOB domain-containing protein 37-like [Ipomoea nil]